MSASVFANKLDAEGKKQPADMAGSIIAKLLACCELDMELCGSDPERLKATILEARNAVDSRLGGLNLLIESFHIPKSRSWDDSNRARLLFGRVAALKVGLETVYTGLCRYGDAAKMDPLCFSQFAAWCGEIFRLEADLRLAVFCVKRGHDL